MKRAISFFETLARDVNFALRTLRRAPLVVLTIVSTIALGLGVVTVAFTGVPCVARAAGGQCPHGDEHSAAGVHRTDRLRRTDGSSRRLARVGIPDRLRVRVHRDVRPRSGVALDTPRAGASDAR